MTRGEAFEILGLDPDASLDEARKTYRRLAKTYHPDKNPASNAAVMFRIIQDAWVFIQNDTEQEYAEAEARQELARAEAQRKRSKAEAARQQAKAAHAEDISKRKEEAVEKNIKRFCYLAWFIFLAIYSAPRALSAGESIFMVFLVCCIGCLFYGWITVRVIIRIRRWFK